MVWKRGDVFSSAEKKKENQMKFWWGSHTHTHREFSGQLRKFLLMQWLYFVYDTYFCAQCFKCFFPCSGDHFSFLFLKEWTQIANMIDVRFISTPTHTPLPFDLSDRFSCKHGGRTEDLCHLQIFQPNTPPHTRPATSLNIMWCDSSYKKIVTSTEPERGSAIFCIVTTHFANIAAVKWRNNSSDFMLSLLLLLCCGFLLFLSHFSSFVFVLSYGKLSEKTWGCSSLRKCCSMTNVMNIML